MHAVYHGFAEFGGDQRAGNNSLAEGVAGEPKAGFREDVEQYLNSEQRSMLDLLPNMLKSDEHIGTIEVYPNGAVNLFVRQENSEAEGGFVVIGFFTLRD